MLGMDQQWVYCWGFSLTYLILQLKAFATYSCDAALPNDLIGTSDEDEDSVWLLVKSR